MSRHACFILVAGCVAVTASATARPDPAAAARLRQAQERVVYATAFDAATRTPVANLGADAFVVQEDGVTREILRVSPATSPMPVALVVDNSQAMAPSISDLRRGLSAFVTGIAGLGPVTLVTVADRPTIALGYTSSPPELLAAVNRLFHAPTSGATLVDAISEVAKGIGRRESDRAAIVVVTGEFTEFSQLAYQTVLDDLRESGATLHAVVLSNPAGSFNTEEARTRATVLDRGPRESGGVRIDVLTSLAFEPRLAELAAILRAQYRVVYARPASLIPPRKIEVTAARREIEVRGGPARENKP
jgi:von Willebrand factor type A domain